MKKQRKSRRVQRRAPRACSARVFVTDFMGNYFLREFSDERRIIAMCSRKADAWRIRCALNAVAEAQNTERHAPKGAM